MASSQSMSWRFILQITLSWWFWIGGDFEALVLVERKWAILTP